MQILLYEFVTGGGFLDRSRNAIPASLIAEGAAMRNALADDIARRSGVQLRLLCDGRFPAPASSAAEVVAVSSVEQRDKALETLARAADWTLVVAPEFDRHLERLARQVLAAGGRLLGPSPEVIALAADKHRLAMHLNAHHVRTPHGRTLERNEPLPADWFYPAVLKPNDGAGSLGVQQIAHAGEQDSRESISTQRWRLEEFCPGKAVSVAFLCGREGKFPLPACAQQLSTDGRFEYLGGALPLEVDENRRAQRLAAAAVATLGDVVGYVGVDLVLDRQGLAAKDVVIEINPRVTTSYVGLRAASRTNLVQAMLDAAEGRVPELSFDPRPIRFEATGAVRR